MNTNVPTDTLKTGSLLEPWPLGWITLPMAAVTIGKSRSHVDSLARAGKIKAKMIATDGIPGWLWAIDPSSLDPVRSTEIPEYTSNENCECQSRTKLALDILTIAEKLSARARIELEQ